MWVSFSQPIYLADCGFILLSKSYDDGLVLGFYDSLIRTNCRICFCSFDFIYLTG